MSKIVAIGGGEISKHETMVIDKEIIRLSGKKHPKVLFIPTASSDEPEYIKIFINYYGKYLGCTVDILELVKQHVSTITHFHSLRYFLSYMGQVDR